MAFCGLLSHVKKIVLLIFVSFFYLLMIFLASFRFCCVSFRFVSALSCFVSIVSRFVSFRFCLLTFVSFLFRFLFYNHPIEVIVKQETKQNWVIVKQETKQKRNETQQKRNEAKKIINK